MVFKLVLLSLLFSLFRVDDLLEMVMDMSKERGESFCCANSNLGGFGRGDFKLGIVVGK